MRRDNPRKRNNKRRKMMYKPDIDHEKTSKGLAISIPILVVILVCVAIFYYFKNTENYNNLMESAKQAFEQEQAKEQAANNSSNEDSQSPAKEATDTTFTLASIGDVMCNNSQYMDAFDTSTNTYDFSYIFEETNLYTKTADITVANLETSFAGANSKSSDYNSPDSLAYALKNIGVDVISTAGNHCLDMGFDGLTRTIDVLDDADIAHLGTYKNQEEQDKVLIKYIKGVKIAFINYTYGINGISVPKDKPFCVNLIDKDLIKKHIDAAKAENVDMIIACMHWGTEYKTTTNKEQTELTDFLFQSGVDIILGNHPHVLQNMEKKTVTLDDGTTKDCFVAYSLGNFIGDQKDTNTRNSIILNLTITKHVEGNISIDKVDYVPIYMNKDTSLKTKSMKLIDITKAIENYDSYFEGSISSSLYNTLKTQLNKIISIVGFTPSYMPTSMMDYNF